MKIKPSEIHTQINIFTVIQHSEGHSSCVKTEGRADSGDSIVESTTLVSGALGDGLRLSGEIPVFPDLLRDELGQTYLLVR